MSGQDLEEIVHAVADTEKVGEVYVVMYSAGCEGTETTQTIRAHHSVVVDIYGESTLHDIVGYEFHIGLAGASNPEATRVPDVRILGGFVRVPKQSGLSVTHNLDLKSLKWILLGKIDLPKEQLGQAVLALQQFAVDVFTSLTRNGRTWSDSVNCQQYCRLFVEQLLGSLVPYPFSVIGLNSLPEWLRGCYQRSYTISHLCPLRRAYVISIYMAFLINYLYPQQTSFNTETALHQCPSQSKTSTVLALLLRPTQSHQFLQLTFVPGLCGYKAPQRIQECAVLQAGGLQ
jgi:hypothetical protein